MSKFTAGANLSQLKTQEGGVTLTPEQAAILETAVDRMLELRNQLRAANKVVKEIKEQIGEHEHVVFDLFEEVGLDHGVTTNAALTIGFDRFPNITDWDDFKNYMIQTDQLELLQRRANASGLRDIQSMLGPDQAIPGIDWFSKKKLSLVTI